VESRAPHAFKAVHERIARNVSAQIAMVLESSQMLEGTILLADVDRLMFTEDSQHAIDAALERVMAGLKRLEHIQHSGAQILFLRGENELEIVHSTNKSDIGMTVDVARSICGRAIRDRQTKVFGHVRDEEDYQGFFGESIQSEIAVPILFGEDNIPIGVLNVESEEAEAFMGFYRVTLESFAEKVKTLLAFAKLRADVTEALELRTANDLLAAVGDQTSHLVHRLNNTVGAMRLRIIELQEKRKDGSLEGDEFLDESLEALLSLAERTLKMPDDITRLLGQGRANADVNQCVRDAIKVTSIPADIRLVVRLDEHIPIVPLYCFDIVVQNLLKNAVDAMPQGGRLYVTTSAVLHPTLRTGYFQLMVLDTGQGIPVDIQGKVFELNFTTKRDKGSGLGLGLGLWWVRNFVRRARGDITIRSTPGSGTEVTVKIPVDHPAGAHAADDV
jgi:signal transduction histidine kinase